jgi:predicted RNA-binding Zn-ribbon protein involved in translation (DUF1610 family)
MPIECYHCDACGWDSDTPAPHKDPILTTDSTWLWTILVCPECGKEVSQTVILCPALAKTSFTLVRSELDLVWKTPA